MYFVCVLRVCKSFFRLIGDGSILKWVGSLIVDIICWGIESGVSIEGWGGYVIVRGVFCCWGFVVIEKFCV